MWTASLDVCLYILGRCTIRGTVFIAKLVPSYWSIELKTEYHYWLELIAVGWLRFFFFLQPVASSGSPLVVSLLSCGHLSLVFLVNSVPYVINLATFFYIFNWYLFFLNINLSSLTILTCFCNHFIFPATILHASFRTPNLKARLNTFREEFRAVWRNYSEL